MNNLFVVAAALLFSASVCRGQNSAHAAKIPENVEKLLQKHACLACHKADARVVGPAYLEVAKKKYTKDQILELVYNPKPANWPGYPPMTPMKHVPKEDVLVIAGWINSLVKK